MNAVDTPAPIPVAQRQRRPGSHEWIFTECRPATLLGVHVDVEPLYGAEALLHVPTPPPNCPTTTSASGEYTICSRCGEAWKKDGQRACVSAHKILSMATREMVKLSVSAATHEDQKARDARIQNEVREAIQAYLPALREATSGLVEVGNTIDLNDEWAGLVPWFRDVSELDAKTNEIKEARSFVNKTQRFKVAKVRPFANFFSPDFVFGWAASVYPEGVDPEGGVGEVVLMGTFFKLKPKLNAHYAVEFIDMKPLQDFLLHWDAVKAQAQIKRA